MDKRVAPPRKGKRSRPSRAPRTAAKRLTVPATRAARGFSDLLNRVEYRQETFVIERGGRAVCEVSPVGGGASTLADLVALLGTLPRVDKGYLEAVEAALNGQPPLPPSPWES